MKTVVIAGLCLGGLLYTASGIAVVFGGSNLGPLGYPDAHCRKPYNKPLKPYSFSSQYEVDAYNRQVDAYNDELRDYRDCVVAYVENAQHDIERIQEAIDNIVSEAKREI